MRAVQRPARRARQPVELDTRPGFDRAGGRAGSRGACTTKDTINPAHSTCVSSLWLRNGGENEEKRLLLLAVRQQGTTVTCEEFLPRRFNMSVSL